MGTGLRLQKNTHTKSLFFLQELVPFTCRNQFILLVGTSLFYLQEPVYFTCRNQFILLVRTSLFYF